jgi:uncharacterized membrane protein
VLAITLYLTLKSLHVLAAITWVGGAITTQAYAIRTMRSRDPQRMVSLTKDVEFIGQRMYTSASLVLLVLGIWMVIIGPWSFGMAWILSALKVDGGGGAVLSGGTAADQAHLRHLEDRARVPDLVVFDMVVKPGA